MSVDVVITGVRCCEAHGHQFTYNYSPALREAGMPPWKWFDGVPLYIAAYLWEKTIVELAANRSSCEPLIRGNGEWGTWDTMMEQMSALLVDAMKHADEGTQVSVT